MVEAGHHEIGCYLDLLSDPRVNADPKDWVGVRAAHQLGVLATPEVPGRIMAILPAITSAGLRELALEVVDALSPRGDPVIAGQLHEMVDEALASGTPDRLGTVPSLAWTLTRFQLRAEP